MKENNPKMPDLVGSSLMAYNGEEWVILSDNKSRYIIAVSTWDTPTYLAICSLCPDSEPMTVTKVSMLPGVLTDHDRARGNFHYRDYWYRIDNEMGNLSVLNDCRQDR